MTIGVDPSYTSVLEVFRLLNLYTEVYSEVVGTGTGAQFVWPLAQRKVVDSSEKIYVAGVLKTKTTALVPGDYTINYDTGVVTFTAAPGSVAITADYYYGDINSSQVTEHILHAEDEINRRVGRSFFPTQTIVEVQDGIETNDSSWQTYYSTRFRDEMTNYNAHQQDPYLERTVFTKNYPILTVAGINTEGDYALSEAVGTGAGVVTVFPLDYTAIVPGSEVITVAGVAQVRGTNYTINNTTGVVTFLIVPTGAIVASYWYDNYTTTEYNIDLDAGRIVLTTAGGRKITQGSQKIGVVYTYGYGTVPQIVSKLCAWIVVYEMMKQRLMGSPVPLGLQAGNIREVEHTIIDLYFTLGLKMEVLPI